MAPRQWTEPEEIAHLLRSVHDGEPWHGPSRVALLADVTADVAAWDPGAGAHGLWQQVLHMRNWTREVEARTMGKRPGRADPVGGDWPEIGDTSEAAWRETLASLDAAHHDMVEMVLKLPAARLHENVGATVEEPNGSAVSVGTMIRSLAEHDLYHCGQVSLLKRLARGALGLPQT